MEELIVALRIIIKYMNKDDYSYKWPLSAGHDVLFIGGVDIKDMSLDTIKTLSGLHWYPGAPDSNPDGFDIDELTEESWKELREELDQCMHSYI